jgi:hypothetical protein
MTLEMLARSIEPQDDPNASGSSNFRGPPPITARKLNTVFAIFGWLTLLYDPVVGKSESVFRISQDHLIHDTQYLALSRPHADSKKKLMYFLKGFGMFLPPREHELHAQAHEPATTTATRKQTMLSSDTFNIYFLASIGKLKVRWTDHLPSHLFLDIEQRILYIFQFPSYCLGSLTTGPPTMDGNEGLQSILHRSVKQHLFLHPVCNRIELSEAVLKVPNFLEI